MSTTIKNPNDCLSCGGWTCSKCSPKGIGEMADPEADELAALRRRVQVAELAILVEREVCAQLAEAQSFAPGTVLGVKQQFVKDQIAAAIRARGAQ